MSLKALRVILFLISFIYTVIKICWIADLLGILVKVKSRFYCLIAFSICKGCSATRTFSIMFCYKIFAHFHSLIGKIYLNWNIIFNRLLYNCPYRVMCQITIQWSLQKKQWGEVGRRTVVYQITIQWGEVVMHQRVAFTKLPSNCLSRISNEEK